jgi:CRP-like cAMP-binding protein
MHMSLEDEITLMARIPVLAELDPEALRILAFSADTRSLQPGDMLFRRGTKSDSGYFVLSGSLSLLRDVESRQEVGVASRGDLIGEMAMIAPTEHSVTVIAREPTTLLRIARTLFQRVLREYPGSAARLRAAIEKKLLLFNGELATLRSSTD